MKIWEWIKREFVFHAKPKPQGWESAIADQVEQAREKIMEERVHDLLIKIESLELRYTEAQEENYKVIKKLRAGIIRNAHAVDGLRQLQIHECSEGRHAMTRREGNMFEIPSWFKKHKDAGQMVVRSGELSNAFVKADIVIAWNECVVCGDKEPPIPIEVDPFEWRPASFA